MRADQLSQLRALMEEKCIRRGDFTLASGLPAKYYYDGKQATLRPESAKLIGSLVLELVHEAGAEAVGGLAVGADPIATAVAIASGDDGRPAVPGFIVRSQPKDHGTKDQTSAGFADDGEPLLKPGRKVAIVDDVITTGGSIVQAIEVVEAMGCEVVVVIALVERHEGGGAKLAERGYNFRRLFYTTAEGDLLVDEQLIQRAEAAA